MSETPAEPTPSTSNADAPANNDAAESGTDWQAEARKWEARAKENKDARKELDQLKTASMTEAERVAADLTQTQQQRDEAVSELARLRAGLKYGLDEKQLALLGPGTDDIDARAQELANYLAQAGSPRKPQPDPSQGRAAPSGASPAEQFAAALGGAL